MIAPALLASLFAQNSDQIARLVAGLTHEESLRRPPGGGNPLNWTIGHLTIARANVLALLGAAPAWDWAAGRRYLPGSPPLTDPADALPLDRLLADFATAGRQLADGLRDAAPATLAEVQEGKALGAQLAEYALHEAYHAGQIEVVRQVTRGKGDQRET